MIAPAPVRVAVLYLWPLEDVSRVALRSLIGRQLDAYQEEGSGRWLATREEIVGALRASDPFSARAWERYFEESDSDEVFLPCWACTPVHDASTLVAGAA